MRRLIAAAVMVIGSGLALGPNENPAAAQTTTPLARLDCTADNFPDCGGWVPVPDNPYHTRRLIEGGGPHGQNVVEFTQLPATSQAQYYFGFGGRPLPDPPQGSARYLRFRFRTVGAVALEGPDGVWSSKFVIVADGDPTSRLICALRDDGRSSNNFNIGCARNIDTYPNATQRLVPMPRDRWVSIQMEFKSSTTPAAADGRLAIWGDNDIYAKPTTQSGQIPLSARGWGRISLGFYANATIRTGSRAVFQIADVEIDDEFDPAWQRSGVSAAPEKPAPDDDTRWP